MPQAGDGDVWPSVDDDQRDGVTEEPPAPPAAAGAERDDTHSPSDEPPRAAAETPTDAASAEDAPSPEPPAADEPPSDQSPSAESGPPAGDGAPPVGDLPAAGGESDADRAGDGDDSRDGDGDGDGDGGDGGDGDGPPAGEPVSPAGEPATPVDEADESPRDGASDGAPEPPAGDGGVPSGDGASAGDGDGDGDGDGASDDRPPAGDPSGSAPDESPGDPVATGDSPGPDDPTTGDEWPAASDEQSSSTWPADSGSASAEPAESAGGWPAEEQEPSGWPGTETDEPDPEPPSRSHAAGWPSAEAGSWPTSEQPGEPAEPAWGFFTESARRTDSAETPPHAPAGMWPAEPPEEPPRPDESRGRARDSAPPVERADRTPRAERTSASERTSPALRPPLAERPPRGERTPPGEATQFLRVEPPRGQPGDPPRGRPRGTPTDPRAPRQPPRAQGGDTTQVMRPVNPRDSMRTEPVEQRRIPAGESTQFIRPEPARMPPYSRPDPRLHGPAPANAPRSPQDRARTDRDPWPPSEPPRAAPRRVGLDTGSGHESDHESDYEGDEEHAHEHADEPADQRRNRKPLLVTAIAVVAVLLVAAGVVFAVPGVSDKLGLTSSEPEVVIDPPAPPVEFTPGLRAPSADAPAPTPAGVRSALAGPTASGDLGTLTGVVLDPASGETLWESDPTTPLVPASTGKLLTTAAALLSLDHTAQLSTKVVEGDQPGTVVIVGGGDPTLSSLEPGVESVYPGAAHLSDLVDQVRASGVAVRSVQIDLSRYTGDSRAPGWVAGDVAAGYIAPMVPAMLDGGRQDATVNYSPRTSNPARALAEEFATRIGATVPADAETTAPQNAKVLGEVHSAPLVALVDNLLHTSDNVLAEAVAREVAKVAGEEVSFEGASTATLGILRDNGFDLTGTTMADASGLSTEDKVPARVLAEILTVAAGPNGEDPRTAKLRPLIGGLPVAGGSGTLDHRFDDAGADGRGWVRAKTGTLSGVNSLAGVVLDKDGRLLVFALMTSGGGATESVRDALDVVAATLRDCGCR